MTAMVHASGLMSGIANRPIPFAVGGTCADPVFRPDLKAIVKEEVKGEVGKAAEGVLKGLLGGKKKN